MFSRRTAWDRTPNRLAAALEAAKGAGRPLVDLTESNPTRAGLFDSSDLVQELGHPRSVTYEPEALGHETARAAVAAYYARRGVVVPSDRVVIAASTSESYSWLFGLLADEGDSVLIPNPSYPLFGWIAEMKGVTLRSYRLDEDADYRIDEDDLRASIDETTRAILLVHPNNPTGSFVRRDEARALFRIAREHDLAIVVDEVFGDYAHGAQRSDALGSFAEIAHEDDAPLVFVLSGLSKVMLLPQFKLGWMLVQGPDALVREAILRLELIADTYLSVATPVQLALPAILAKQPTVLALVQERLRTNLAALDDALASLGDAAPVRRQTVEGGWYVVLQVPRVHDDETWVLLLIREEGLIVHPGYFFDFDGEGILVVSLLPPPDVFRDAARRLVRRLASA